MVDTKTKVSTIANESYQTQGRYFFYDSPLSKETGAWIPVSVPPMSNSTHKNWEEGLSMDGGYLPDGDMGWNQFLGEDKQLTMWDVFTEMVIAAGGKVSLLLLLIFINSRFVECHHIFWRKLGRRWLKLSFESNIINVKEILEAEPPRWIPDSASSACMLCNVRFHPIMCSKHHCCFCGGLFCGQCSKGRSLLPVKFHTSNPERVCDVCCVRLESVQAYLMDQVSRAAHLPTHDLTDLSTLRSWFNFPWGQSMEYEIYKATNIIRCYDKAGVEFTDFIIVLRTMDAVRTFGGNVHFLIGAGVGMAAGFIGRVAKADVRAGDGGLAACYTYSCSKGAFAECSLQGSIFTTRKRENSKFYGSSSIDASDILLGKLPKPPAASILYEALSNLCAKLCR